jgi:hypothetical protein
MEGDLAFQPIKTASKAREMCTLENKLGAFMLTRDALAQSGVEKEGKVHDEVTELPKKRPRGMIM